MKIGVSFLIFGLPLLFNLSACNSSKETSLKDLDNTNSKSHPPVQVSNFSLPGELETIPADNHSSALSLNLNSSAFFSKIENQLSDYQKEKTELKVFVPALEEFEIVDSILSALKQSGYDDERNLNQGPYSALIRWEENQQFRLERWIIESSLITENGKLINLVNVWPDVDGNEDVIKAKFRIYQGATLSHKYGHWELDVNFSRDGNPNGTFKVTVTPIASEQTLITLNMNHDEHFMGESFTMTSKGKLLLSGDQGKGIISYSNVNGDGSSFTVQDKTALYAYNPGHVLINENNQTSCLDRTNYTDIFMDYNVYLPNGDNIEKHKNFGISLEFIHPVSGKRDHAYYGAWQGRHGLYYGNNNGETIPLQTSFTSVTDVGSYPKDSHFTNAEFYSGYLVERSKSPANLEEITNTVIETYDYRSFSLKYDEEHGIWKECVYLPSQWNCQEQNSPAFDLSLLQSNASKKQRADIYGPFGQTRFNAQSKSLEILSGNNWTTYRPQDQEILWAYVSGPLYLKYDGTNWFKYDHSFSDEKSWNYTLGNLTPFSFIRMGQYTLRSFYTNYNLYVGSSENQQTFTIEKETENVITPGSYATEVAKLTLSLPYQMNQTYSFDSSSMQLRNSANEVVTDDLWGLEVTDLQGNTRRFGWTAKKDGETWRNISYLHNANNERVLLDSAITFKNFDLNGKTISHLSFDGHLFGIPDTYRLLQENDNQLTDDLKAKIINIPEGSYHDASNPTISYIIRPAYGHRYLSKIPVNDCQVTLDQSFSLASIPEYVPFTLEDAPLNAPLKMVMGEYVTN